MNYPTLTELEALKILHERVKEVYNALDCRGITILEHHCRIVAIVGGHLYCIGSRDSFNPVPDPKL